MHQPESPTGATEAQETKEGSESEAGHAKEKKGSDSEVAKPADPCVDCNCETKFTDRQAWHHAYKWTVGSYKAWGLGQHPIPHPARTKPWAPYEALFNGP